MRVLITGASGLLGINLALQASQARTPGVKFPLSTAAEPVVYGVVNRHPLKTKAFTVLQADLTQAGAVERLLDEIQPDWIINCAAQANLEECEADPELANTLNVELPRKLATCVGRGGARLVHISTDAVFDGKKGDYREKDPPNPLSVYARTKLAGEQAVLAGNPQALVARVNLFGWSLTGSRSLGEFFYNNLSAGKQVMGFTDVYFCPLLANDLWQILSNMLSLNASGLYHIFSSDALSKYAFGVEIASRFGFNERLILPVSVQQSGLVAARSPNLTMNTEKLASLLGEPLPRLSTALDRFSTLYQQGYPQMLRQL